MGKYDGVVKFLGKEDSFTPDQIKQGIESAEKMESLNDMSDISQMDMANVDKLISGDAPPASSPVIAKPMGDSHVDPEVLKEMEGLDATPPNLEELQSRLQVTNYETPTDELMEEITSDDTPADETPAGDEAEDSGILEPQFAKMTPDEPQEEIPLPPMLDDSTPPQDATGDTDNISDLLGQLKPTEQAAPVEDELPTMPDLAGTPDVSMPIETEVQVPQDAFELPAMGTEPDLSTVFGPLASGDSGETAPEVTLPESGKAPEDFAFEMPKMDSSVPAKDDFELPADFGMQPEPGPTPQEDMRFDTSKLPQLDDDMMPGLGKEEPRPETVKRKTEELHDEFMDIKDEFQPRKGKDVPPEILRTPKEAIKTSYGLDIDQDKAVKIRNKINKIVNPMLRKKVRYAFIEAKLPDNIMQQLIPMILLGEEEQNIAELIDSYVPESVIKAKEVRPEEKGSKPKRKVIHTEESLRAKDFQRDLQNITRYSFILFFAVIVLGIVFWRGIVVPAQARVFYQDGLKALKDGQYDKSESKFKAGKNIGGPDMKWYNEYAKAFENKKMWDSAKAKYDEALNAQPYDKKTIYNYTQLLVTKLSPPEWDLAIQKYQRLREKSPNEYEYINQTAQIYVLWASNTPPLTPLMEKERDERYRNAYQLYGDYLVKNPKHIPSYYRQLDIALRGTNNDRIDQLYERIDELNKRAVDFNVLTSLGQHYIDNRTNAVSMDMAKKVFDKIMQVDQRDNTNAETFFQYARYLTVNYDYTKAIRTVSKATNLDPLMGKAYNLLGEIYTINDTIPNNIYLAKMLFENARVNSPGYYKPLANLGNIYFYNSLNFANSEKALSDSFDYYKQAKLLYNPKLYPTDNVLLYNLGWLYYYYGKEQNGRRDAESMSNALDNFNELYREDTANPVLSYVVGNTYYNLYKMNPRSFKFLNLAKAEYDKAIEYYEAIAKKIKYINPNVDRHREVYTQLARCYNNRGVVFTTLSKKAGGSDEQALLDFYRSKDSANKINFVYAMAEYNIKFILNSAVKKKKPAFDDELVKRTTLQKLTEELRRKMFDTL